MLNIENLHVYYGVIQALQGISFHLNKGEIVALIGANGAGKTTTLRTISGLMRPAVGKIRFEETTLTDKNPEQIVRMGIVHVPEGRKIFSRMTVLENLHMGAFIMNDKVQIARDIEQMLQVPRLAERGQLGETLWGVTAMLTIARGC